MNRESSPNHKSKQGIYLLIAFMLTILVGIGVYSYIKNAPKPVANQVYPSSRARSDTLRAVNGNVSRPRDSVATISRPIGWNEENNSWRIYRVIATSVNAATRNLPFGTKVWVDDSKSDEIHKVVFSESTMENQSNITYKINADMLIEEYRFEKYRNNFALTPFSTLAPGIKKILLEDQYSEGNTYTLTQNEARAASSVAFGDFDEDGIQDVAVMLDNNEKQISRLLIFCSNKVTKQHYIAFAENYNDKMRIRSFRENAKIYMDTREFVAAPRDGIILTAEDIVLAIVYTVQDQKFKTYFQE